MPPHSSQGRDMTNEISVPNLVLKREQQRCQALASDDFSTLAELLSKDLLHVHTRGNSDTYESYLRYVQETLQLLNVERGELRVRHYGDTVIMSGKQANTACLRNGDGTVMLVESHVLQVWNKEIDGEWRLTSFQATALGAPTQLRGPER